MSTPVPHSENSDKTKAARGRLLAPVNGLRGLAIAAVMTQHVLTGVFTPGALTINIAGFAISALPLVTNGWTGVNLFFILSGFVLYLPLANQDQPMESAGERLNFYYRRCRRLLPMFYIAVVATWLLAMARGEPTSVGELLSVTSFAYVFTPEHFGPSFNIALWSIGLEVGFSLLFPLLILWVRRWNIWRVAITIAVLALVMRTAGILRAPLLQGPSLNSDAIVCRIDEFVFGMALAWAYVRGMLPRRGGGLALFGAAFVVLAWIGFDQVLHGQVPPVARAGLNDLLDCGLVAIVIGALAPEGRLGAVLAWRPLQVMGMMCYSLYLWHWPLLQWLAPERAAMTPAILITSLALFVAVTFSLSALTYRFVEFGRVRDWRGLFLLDPQRPSAPPAIVSAQPLYGNSEH
jgi:peptidoglycan/LPS O-acetylase OafA/YrhL